MRVSSLLMGELDSELPCWPVELAIISVSCVCWAVLHWPADKVFADESR